MLSRIFICLGAFAALSVAEPIPIRHGGLIDRGCNETSSVVGSSSATIAAIGTYNPTPTYGFHYTSTSVQPVQTSSSTSITASYSSSSTGISVGPVGTKPPSSGSTPGEASFQPSYSFGSYTPEYGTTSSFATEHSTATLTLTVSPTLSGSIKSGTVVGPVGPSSNTSAALSSTGGPVKSAPATLLVTSSLSFTTGNSSTPSPTQSTSSSRTHTLYSTSSVAGPIGTESSISTLTSAISSTVSPVKSVYISAHATSGATTSKSYAIPVPPSNSTASPTEISPEKSSSSDFTYSFLNPSSQFTAGPSPSQLVSGSNTVGPIDTIPTISATSHSAQTPHNSSSTSAASLYSHSVAVSSALRVPSSPSTPSSISGQVSPNSRSSVSVVPIPTSSSRSSSSYPIYRTPKPIESIGTISIGTRTSTIVSESSSHPIYATTSSSSVAIAPTGVSSSTVLANSTLGTASSSPTRYPTFVYPTTSSSSALVAPTGTSSSINSSSPVGGLSTTASSPSVSVYPSSSYLGPSNSSEVVGSAPSSSGSPIYSVSSLAAALSSSALSPPATAGGVVTSSTSTSYGYGYDSGNGYTLLPPPFSQVSGVVAPTGTQTTFKTSARPTTTINVTSEASTSTKQYS